MTDRYACPSKRCKGRLEVQATGQFGEDQAVVEFTQCGTCGRIVELAPDLSDHPVLFAEEA